MNHGQAGLMILYILNLSYLMRERRCPVNTREERVVWKFLGELPVRIGTPPISVHSDNEWMEHRPEVDTYCL